MGFIKFLGTAGARFVMIRQLRSSAGIWLNYKSTNVIIDPGPGSLVRCHSSRPKLDPNTLDAILLTHKHLDHSGDVNVMIEAMTNGGFQKKGILFLPSDAIGNTGVVFSYAAKFVEKIVFLGKGNFSVGDIHFKIVTQNVHSVETYGVKFTIDKNVISLVSDTKYFKELIECYKDSDILILNVVFDAKKEEYDHLSLEEALPLIKKIKASKTIITHFGIPMLKKRPHLLEKQMEEDLKMDIKCAYDGFTLEIPYDNKIKNNRK